jgi:hypothetical protein
MKTEGTMKARILFFFLVSIALHVQISVGQLRLDTVLIIYSTAHQLHSITFMKYAGPYRYWTGTNRVLAFVEDSNSTSMIKAARVDEDGNITQAFSTLFTRPFPVGGLQLIGIGDYPDSLSHQYLFWEEQDSLGWRVEFSHRTQSNSWETPSPFSPSPFEQRDPVCTQTDATVYPPPFSFAIGWNENDSVTIVKLTPDSAIFRARVATHAKNDSIHPALADGMVAWETRDSLSMLRFAIFDAGGVVSETDTIPFSRNGASPIFLNPASWYQDEQKSLFWERTANGVGNIIGTTYSSLSLSNWSPVYAATQDSTGTNIPFFASFSPVVIKSSRRSYGNFDYLAFIRTVKDSNAFVRMNHSWDSQRLEFRTKNRILDIDAAPGPYVASAWIEESNTGFDICLHTGAAFTVAVETNPSIAKAFLLEQNYPNPFNPSTTIRYYLPITGKVKLSVFDMLGRELATLVNERQINGYHEVKWNADAFPSGLYFYRLKNEKNSLTKKMILVR